ncbi:hypothetical protein [Pseudanabaena sp. 'Roaring Creek']|uniref:hypothetical protein n=1 Tax=Pseudanabaena sp. 'Roaring Creek' TaxID=1681830 RepID=UPI0006D83064|nr:hypothetical protein [Pseudanabaena sp. 'Roaring Creek']
MKIYKPSNIASSQSISILAVASLVSGVAVGSSAAFISKFIYFIILFPLVMGFSTGATLGFIVKKTKIRNPMISLGMGLLGGIITYGSLMYGQYINFQQETEKVMLREYNISDKRQVEEQTNAILQQETGASGFVGFVKLSAKEGTTISRGSSKIKLNDTFSYLLWAVELGIVGFLAASIPFGAAGEPFNEDGNDWYGDKQWVGSVTEESKEELIRFLNTDDISGAAAILCLDSELAMPRIDVHIRSCPSAIGSDSVVTVSHVSTNAKKQVESKKLLEGLVTSEQRSQLVSRRSEETPKDGDIEKS